MIVGERPEKEGTERISVRTRQRVQSKQSASKCKGPGVGGFGAELEEQREGLCSWSGGSQLKRGGR